VRAPGTAGLGASTERLFDDILDGARASATFGAATEATIELLGIARKVFCGADGIADVVVAKDVAGTNNHKAAGSSVMLSHEVSITAAGCKRKNRRFK
jgi:hypothetical protein